MRQLNIPHGDLWCFCDHGIKTAVNRKVALQVTMRSGRSIRSGFAA
jgi:hypothetical protein